MADIRRASECDGARPAEQVATAAAEAVAMFERMSDAPAKPRKS
jgi:hypothetical protein